MVLVSLLPHHLGHLPHLEYPIYSSLSIFQGPSISWSPPAFDNLFNPQFFSTYYLYYWFPNQNPLVKGSLDYPAVTNSNISTA